MNWEAIGAIAELLGAAGVILTLAYLAKQIRISNRASKQAAEQHLLDNTNTWVGRLAENNDLSLLWIRGSKNDSSLTEGDWVRFGALCLEVTQNWERSYLQAKEGNISKSVAERDQRARRMVIGSAGYRRWFASRSKYLTQEFADVIENEMKTAELYSIPYAERSPSDSET